jgi:hypothetical protein
MRQVDGFSVGTPISSNNNTDRHDIAEILLKVALNTITLEIERSASQLHKWDNIVINDIRYLQQLCCEIEI